MSLLLLNHHGSGPPDDLEARVDALEATILEIRAECGAEVRALRDEGVTWPALKRRPVWTAFKLAGGK